MMMARSDPCPRCNGTGIEMETADTCRLCELSSEPITLTAHVLAAVTIWAVDWIAIPALVGFGHAIFGFAWCCGVDRHPFIQDAREDWHEFLDHLDD